MKLKTFLILVIALVASSALSAEMAKIIRMTGTQDVSITLPDDSLIAGTVGLEIPVGSMIEVKAGTRLFFKTFEGQITVVEPDSLIFLETIEVTSDDKEKTVVELKSGNLVANLDPKKRGTNDYGVRTPKGVAAARGTNYTVSVNGQTVVVSVVAGVVSINIPDLSGGTTSVALNPGEASADGGAAQSIASVLTTNPNSTPAQQEAAATTRAALQAAASVVATLAADPTSGVTTETLSAVVGTASRAASDSGDNSLVSQVAATATQANPAAASAIVTAAVTAAPTAATNIVASVTQQVVASQESVATGSSNAATTAQELSQAANDAGTAAGTEVNVDADAVTNAVAPATPTTPATPNTPTTTTETPADLETEVEVEVPTDNTVLRIDTSFTIQLSGGRLVAVTLNSVDNTATAALVTTAQGPVTAQVGNGASTAFTIPAGVATALQKAVTNQQLTAIGNALRTLLNGPTITVPNNTIVVSPSS